MCGADAQRIGIYGFGAAAHILIQVARSDGREIAAFTRDGDHQAQTFANELGAAWSGAWDHAPPWPLDAAIIFAPDGRTVPAALRAVRPDSLPAPNRSTTSRSLSACTGLLVARK